MRASGAGWVAGGLVAGAVALGALAGQGSRPASPPERGERAREGGAPAGEGSADTTGPELGVLRARLERRQAEARRVEARMEEAIGRLDAGEAPREVMEGVEPFRGRGGGARGKGQGGRDAPTRGDAKPDGAERERIIAFMVEQFPRIGERLRALASENPRLGERMLERVTGRAREMMVLRDRDRGLYELRVQQFTDELALADATRRLGAARRGGDGAAGEAEAARREVREIVARQFDARVRVQTREIDSLERRVGELRAEVERRLGERDRLIDERVAHMVEGIESRRDDEGEEPGPAGGR